VCIRLDACELEGSHAVPEEEILFSGTVRHDRMLHAIRLYKDRGSRVVRLESSARRGPMENVPLWTAFVTKYVNNGDVGWANWEGGALISLAALRPQPYVFLSGYHPLRNERGEYVLQFTNNDDAKQFIECWTQLCQDR
jgi:hypothetical protein